jgi:lipoate-protein ligase A
MIGEWRLLLSGPCDPPMNMAIDEAILRLTRRDGVSPTLRLYTWNPPALSIGYFQDSASPAIAEWLARGYPLTRRPTGGLAVLHKDEMSYSIVGFRGRDGFPANGREAYRRAHESIVKALIKLGFDVDVLRDDKPAWTDGLCSSSWFLYDIILAKKGKIGGSAQRRVGSTLLQHGSLALPGQLDQGRLIEEVAKGFGEVFGVKLCEQQLTDEELSLAEELVRGKYGTWEWNYKGRFLSLRRN